MKLQSQAHHKHKGTTYHKHWVVIPNDHITELKWKHGDTLKGTVKGDKLVIEKE